MARKGRRRSDEELREASKHLAYEIDMLYQQGEEFERLNQLKHGKRSANQAEQEKPKPHQSVLNALNEAFYVHAREVPPARFGHLPELVKKVARINSNDCCVGCNLWE